MYYSFNGLPAKTNYPKRKPERGPPSKILHKLANNEATVNERKKFMIVKIIVVFKHDVSLSLPWLQRPVMKNNNENQI